MNNTYEVDFLDELRFLNKDNINKDVNKRNVFFDKLMIIGSNAPDYLSHLSSAYASGFDKQFDGNPAKEYILSNIFCTQIQNQLQDYMIEDRINDLYIDKKAGAYAVSYIGSIKGMKTLVESSSDFFDSLRCDYKGFDEWFKRNNKRKVYVTLNDRKITSFLMLKEEINEKYNFELNEERIFKICTMKVVNNEVGIVEEFIKIIFNRAKESGIKKIYFTVYPKYTDLISFFSKYDFKYYSIKKTMNNNDEINNEYVYVRGL